MRKAFNPYELKRKAFNPFDENFHERINTKVSSNTDWNDKATVLKLVAKNGLNLENANPSLKSDREVVLVAVTQDCYALNYADKKFKSDKSFISEALDHCNGWILSYVDDKIKADKKIVLKAIERDACAINYAPEKLKSDREIALKVVQKDGLALKYLPNFKGDKELVKIAVENDYTDFAYRSASDDLKNDDEVKSLRGKKIDKVLVIERRMKLRDTIKADTEISKVDGEDKVDSEDKVENEISKVENEISKVDGVSKVKSRGKKKAS